MPSERIQRRIDAFLDEADDAAGRADWPAVAERARAVLGFDPENEDARAFLAMAEPNLADELRHSTPAPSSRQSADAIEPRLPSVEQPASFAGGRYEVRRFLGEGGKKRVFLAHDTQLDRDVAFSLIKTEGLDDTGRERITREAQSMGRLGSSPHIVTIYEIGTEAGQPYLVQELMSGGDVEGLVAGGPLPLARTLEIAKNVARGLAFAHDQGVVHRDLKPGNVWLAEDGTAKIGDFGLAVSLDRSRLTQHGMMVGTVAYMPPEQALGGEVTPQADLYSLGAMLYELVTGRPPFQADDPTAIISQHINTPPVSPSWHSEHCPPDLEALILKLLAKVPADRPASAAEVLAALEAVDPNAKSASHSDSSANPLDRLARGVFVGRERELEQLRGAFDNAYAARGSVVMLVGEPGIGKTRTTQELATYARMRGGAVLWGGAQESAGAPPYWPWVQVARAYRDQTLEDERRKQWQPYAADLQRIFPGLRDLFPGLPEPPPIESEEGRFRLFDALSSFLRAVAAEKPLLVVLDDLHWADHVTLQMLTHVARELAHARVLVVGTYRDTDLDRQHPLSRTLAELNREQLFTRINLRGLSRDEVADYIRAAAHVEPPARLIERVHEETEGNAFFLAEVVNLMAQEGSFEKTSSSEVAIPEGVKEALGRRLDRLSAEANELLSLAAVLGREFEHAQLVAVSGKADGEVLGLVEEALAARVLEETGVVGGYRFTHALMQETLLGELSAARRVRVHGQIAEALDTLYGDTAEAHAPELARHYSESSALNSTHAERTIELSRAAGQQAEAVVAWDEAAAHFERCLELLEASPGRRDDEGSLCLSLAIARFANNDDDGWKPFERAVEIFDETPAALAPAVLRIALTLTRLPLRSRIPLWRRLAFAIGDEPSVEACQLKTVWAYVDDSPEADVAAQRASEIAESLGHRDTRLEYLLAAREPFGALYRFEFLAALDGFERLYPLAEAAGMPERAVTPAASTAGYLGDLDRAEHWQARAFAANLATGNKHFADNLRAAQAKLLGRREDKGTFEARIDELPEGAGLRLLRAQVALDAGLFDEATAALPSLADVTFASTTSAQARLLGLRCRIAVAMRDDEGGDAAFRDWRTALDEERRLKSPAGFLILIHAIDDAVCALGDRPFLEALLAEIEPITEWRYSNTGWASGPDYLRGAICLSLHRDDGAEAHFRTGLEWAERWGVDLTVARCRQGLAEVAERRSDFEAARTHLDTAGALFAKHGTKLYLDQVLAKKQMLKA